MRHAAAFRVESTVGRGVQRGEIIAQLRERIIGNVADRPQRMIFRNCISKST